MQQSASKVCDPFAGTPEDKSFHAHVTLARVRDAGGRDRRLLADALTRLRIADAPDWPVRGVRLVRSELDPAGARYTTVAEIPLATTR